MTSCNSLICPKMYGVNLLIFEKDNLWDTFSLTTRKCLTFDNAFLDFKKYLKARVLGQNLVVLEKNSDAYCCKCFQKDSKCILPVKKPGSITNEDMKVSCSCAGEISEDFSVNGKALIRMNGYELSIMFISLIRSSMFRKSVIRNIKSIMSRRDREVLTVILELVPPVNEILDYAWGRRMERLAYETLELNAAMSWLSTLGGAFSALGDEKLACAGIAGRISVHQFKIALRLGDLHTVSRCRLYLALSLMQRGKLKSAKNIIYNEYTKAKQMPEAAIDVRLLRMCQGLWAKLNYSYVLRLRKKSEGNFRNIEP
ncbi:hypothetical protein J437_LFUL014991 [Ladona fulva]|uniref:Uncharacterized protein n=1 Tax=Ladona fulva TaxID=123851 RepID=A0A8K0PAM8_LADFU|nr:hypothetical protein J437_LFUL014991 [Ladona fulva]